MPILIGLALAVLGVLAVAGSLAVGALAAAVAALVAAGTVVATCIGRAAQVLRATAPVTHLDIEPPADSADGDPGYRSYLFGPVVADLREVVVDAAATAWARTLSPADDTDSLAEKVVALWNDRLLVGEGAGKAFFLPSMVGGVLGTVVGSTAGAVFALAVLVVFAVLVAVTLAAALAAAGLLRVFELLMLRLRGITLECGNCHRRVAAPAYDCDACPPHERARHRRLVPGSLGVLSRTCRCGHRLPTLLVRGKAKLTGYCQHDGCNHPLPIGGLSAPTFHVPVVAGTLAGKTVFMLATVAGLDAAARAAGADDGVEFADESRAAEARRMIDALKDVGVDGVPKTQPEQRLRPLTLYQGARDSRSRRLLYLYDAAGERYETSEGLDTLRFVRFTAGVVFVVDPFAIPAVSRPIAEADLESVRPSSTGPAEAAERFTAGLRASLGVGADRPLNVAAALVVTKCDALLSLGSIRHPYEGLAGDGSPGREARSAAVQDWLRTVGAAQLVNHLESNYRRTGYFAVSALAAFGSPVRTSVRTGTEVDNDDSDAPVRWLLSPRKVS